MKSIEYGVSLSAKQAIDRLEAAQVLGEEHVARCQALLAVASQIEHMLGRAMNDPESKGPPAALWMAYDRLLAPLEALAPRRDAPDDAMPGLDPVPET